MQNLPLIKEVPAQVPRKGNSFTQWLGKMLLRITGWRVVGRLPDQPKVIIAAAPHTSNWDFIVAMFVIMSLRIDASYLMKKEAFFWPLAGFFKWLGGVPVDRSNSGGMVGALEQWLTERERAWLLITPEGTRKRVDRYKTGFLRLAAQTNVPLVLVSWDYPTRRLIIEKVWTITDDYAADCENIRQYLNNRYTARHPQWQ